ncbi:hypothetical protein C1H46_027832 [Malus baccata]|uniref:Uncharacterized protein n=1 Tax=Malus baccata TaxID=106549 RepID=A0A540LJI9_MALBA|nr:hypothetical protein C1H46_027832 [Malus baccata]
MPCGLKIQNKNKYKHRKRKKNKKSKSYLSLSRLPFCLAATTNCDGEGGRIDRARLEGEGEEEGADHGWVGGVESERGSWLGGEQRGAPGKERESEEDGGEGDQEVRRHGFLELSGIWRRRRSAVVKSAREFGAQIKWHDVAVVITQRRRSAVVRSATFHGEARLKQGAAEIDDRRWRLGRRRRRSTELLILNWIAMAEKSSRLGSF